MWSEDCLDVSCSDVLLEFGVVCLGILSFCYGWRWMFDWMRCFEFILI